MFKLSNVLNSMLIQTMPININILCKLLDTSLSHIEFQTFIGTISVFSSCLIVSIVLEALCSCF